MFGHTYFGPTHFGDPYFGGPAIPAGLTPGELARMYALGHIARGGATRGGYHDARVYVAIDGTQYATARVADATKILDGSLSITEVVDTTPNTCRFQTKGFVPEDGQSVVVTLGSQNNGKRLFGGTVLKVTQGYTGTPANLDVTVDAIDWSWGVNRRLVLRKYTSTSASTIATDLIASFTNGITTRHVQTDLDVLDEITFTNQRVTEALTQLAKRVGGYWYIDYLADLHLFVGTEAQLTDPQPLIPTHPTLTDLAVTRDLSQFLTRVYHEGGGVNLLTEVAAGETILPVEDAAWYNTDGGTVTTGQQRIVYTSLDVGRAGSLIGPGIGPASAPTATMGVGAGIEAGVHSYAVTFVTGSGESLPSPSRSVTVGNVAPPAAPTLTVGEWVGAAAEDGVHQYAVTFVTAAGETTGSTAASVTHGAQALPAPTWTLTGTYNNNSGGSLTASTYYGYVATFVTATGDTIASNRTVCYADALNHQLQVFGLPVSSHTSVTARKIYRSIGGSAWVGPYHYVATISDNTTTVFTDGASDASIASAAIPPTSTTATYPGNRTDLSAIPLGPSGTTARKLYRTVAGDSTLKLLGTISDNVATTWTDSYADATLGANIPVSNTAPQAIVTLAAIPIGAATVTSRSLYRTVAGGSQLKLLHTIADNTTTTYVDTIADGSLSTNVPTGDTSGLAQPDGQINAGAIALIVAGPGAFNAAGGWAIIGNGQQVVRYTGISGTSLTGVPASGSGAITATIAYNSTVTAAPALRGIPASGTGAILYAIKKGDPLNLLAQVDDADAQATLAALIGGDGVQEAYLQDQRLSYAEAVARGTAYLAQHNQIDLVVTGATRDVNTGAGRQLTVSLPAPTNVMDTFTIQSVTIEGFSPNILPTYTFHAAATQFSGDDLVRLQVPRDGEPS